MRALTEAELARGKADGWLPDWITAENAAVEGPMPPFEQSQSSAPSVEAMLQFARDRQAIRRAYDAMRMLGVDAPPVVRSRVGMMRLVRAALQWPDAQVRWSWRPEHVARAHLARPLHWR